MNAQLRTIDVQTAAGYLVIINDEHLNYHTDLADLMGSWTPAAEFDWHYGENSDALRAKVCAIYGVDDLEALYDYADDEGDSEALSMYWAVYNAGPTSQPVAIRDGSNAPLIGAMTIATQWVEDSIADTDTCAVMEPIPTIETATLRYDDLKAIKDNIVVHMQACAGERYGLRTNQIVNALSVQLQTVNFALGDTKSVMMAHGFINPKGGKRYRARVAAQMEAAQ